MTCGEGVWSKLSKKASSDINWSVVALASYNGNLTVMCLLIFRLCFDHNQLISGFMVCSRKKGCLHAQVFFIEWNGSTVILTSASLVRSSGDENKIVENLRVGTISCSFEVKSHDLITVSLAD